MVLAGVVSRPDEVNSWAECRILELGVCVDHEVMVTNDRKVSARWSELDSLREGLTLAELFDILRLDDLSIF
jgi:hypothetical protein